jgi:hypothetical protein
MHRRITLFLSRQPASQQAWWTGLQSYADLAEPWRTRDSVLTRCYHAT